jgi:hypothetical protein
LEVLQVTLREAINQLEKLGDSLTIYATKAEVWDLDGPVALLQEEDTPELAEQPEDLSYFLEVSIAKEVLEVWSEWRNEALPSEAERLQAVVYYATNDAYID